MRFEVIGTVPHPREVVYQTLRDDLPRLVPYLPNVARIDVVERSEERPGRWHVVNRWRGKGQVPIVARPFVPRRYLSWIDDAHWVDANWQCRWRFETALPEVCQCEGINHFGEPEPGRTEIRLCGDLTVDLARMRGLPRIFRRASPRAASFLVARVKPNLEHLVRALDRYLSEQRRAQAR